VSNSAVIRETWPELYTDCQRAESYPVPPSPLALGLPEC